MMFGGSPMRVAVPPMFEAKIWLIRYGNGETPRVRAIDSVTGVSRTTVVTLSSTAARTAVSDGQEDQQSERLAAREVDGVAGDVLEEAGLGEAAGQHHHPGQQEDDVEVDRREGLFLVDDAEDHDQQAAEERDQRPVNALGRDQPVGDDEDAASEEDVHVSPPRTPVGARSSPLGGHARSN